MGKEEGNYSGVQLPLGVESGEKGRHFESNFLGDVQVWKGILFAAAKESGRAEMPFSASEINVLLGIKGLGELVAEGRETEILLKAENGGVVVEVLMKQDEPGTVRSLMEIMEDKVKRVTFNREELANNINPDWVSKIDEGKELLIRKRPDNDFDVILADQGGIKRRYLEIMGWLRKSQLQSWVEMDGDKMDYEEIMGSYCDELDELWWLMKEPNKKEIESGGIYHKRPVVEWLEA